MSEFVKKTMIGYKELDSGRSNPECTHVILTVKEYDNPVSYTHLDVYKRQLQDWPGKSIRCWGSILIPKETSHRPVA